LCVGIVAEAVLHLRADHAGGKVVDSNGHAFDPEGERRSASSAPVSNAMTSQKPRPIISAIARSEGRISTSAIPARWLAHVHDQEIDEIGEGPGPPREHPVH
jgi:hypothetical protein